VIGNGTPEETRDFVAVLNDSGLGRTVAFLILAHTRTRTDSGEDDLDRLSGAWGPHADAILMLARSEGNRARLSYPKTRWCHGAVPASIVAFDPDTETFTLVARDTDEPDKVGPETYEERVLDWLAEHPWATTEELDTGVTGQAQQVRKARQRLHEAGRLSSAPSHKLGRPGRDTRWNLSNEAAQSPVPTLETGQDGSPLCTPETVETRPPVPPLREGRGETGIADGAVETVAMEAHG
jgi:hypothetical protein